MTDINNINSIAREIVTNLDKQDGKEDGKIEASIWNKFVCKKQGNEIHNYINTNSAIKSVVAYLKREVAKTGQAIEDVANEWLKNVGGGDKGEINPNKTKLNQGEESDDLTMSLMEADSPEEQLKIDNANQLLADVATGKYRYKIEEHHVEGFNENITSKSAILADGRHIKIRLDGNKLWDVSVTTNDKKGFVFYNGIGETYTSKGTDDENLSDGWNDGITKYNRNDIRCQL